MKAAIRTQYGPPEVLRIAEIPKPTPKADELLVRVRATTVNRTDAAMLAGKPFIYRFFIGLFKPKRPTTGTDFAGEVEAVGETVKNFAPGDRVWGFDENGLSSHAQYLAIAADASLRKMPPDISFEQAAASVEGAHYARNFLNKVDLRPGQKALVNGATGAIGSAAVQMLKHAGASVTATCGNEHLETVRQLGADRVINYQREDFTQDYERYDFVFDAVGKSTFGACKPLLRERGIYLSSELGPGAQNPLLALSTSLRKGKQVKFPMPVDVPASLEYVDELIRADAFRPLIDRYYPLDDIAEAFRYVATGQKIGNVVIQM